MCVCMSVCSSNGHNLSTYVCRTRMERIIYYPVSVFNVDTNRFSHVNGPSLIDSNPHVHSNNIAAPSASFVLDA